MSIPVQNIYYLLSYAWDKAEIEPADNSISGEWTDAPINLLTSMFLPELEQLVLHGLAVEYILKKREIKGIKGKLIIQQTFQEGLISQGKTSCAVEEPSPDILPNQIIKSALTRIAQTKDVARDLAGIVKRILPAFEGVSDQSFNTISRVVIPRYQQKRYQFIINCCTFLLESQMPISEKGEYYFKGLLNNKKQMARVFEAFVRNFFRREQSKFKVKSEKLNWQGQGVTPEAQQLLPAMFTDVSLQTDSQKIIIDTKYYKKALVQNYKKDKLISKHLYQLFTYLHHAALKNNQQKLEGMLLYPVVTNEFNLEYQLGGFTIRVCTINLNQSWFNIKKDLLGLIG